ncbi:MAG: hypothetical protein KDB88_01035 [Flavobacteriales bacterium]|nr:hypothetical protein [Flavobacteriales bacterium]
MASPLDALLPATRGMAICALAMFIGPGHEGLRAQDLDSARYEFRPTFSAGVGMLAFYGDIGNDHSAFSPLVSRLGYELRAGAPVTRWLEASLFAMHGRVGVNERGTLRNLNMESRLTVGGLQLTYNFANLLPPQHVVEPYLSVGFSSVEFLTKTDLYDDQGRAYHYWSDGTIRDLREDDPNAGDAVLLQRDHTYESDVRELDLDGFGRYNERTWSIPVGFGAQMHLGGGFRVRVGTTMHFTTSDLIDGVTEESVGTRAGDARNDRFLYSNVSIGYAIGTSRKPRERNGPDLSPEEIDAIALLDDEDGDGVTDMYDLCPFTPAGAAVDKNGCPLDSDGDGVPDHLDLEPTTTAGAPVDRDGVTISDEDLLKAFLNYKDSANANIITSRAESFGPPIKPGSGYRKGRVYVVKVGTEVEGISEELIERILSIPDVRTIEKGDTTFYVVGEHANIPDALRRQLRLRAQGIEGDVMAEENGELVDVSAEVGAAKVSMGAESAVTTTKPDAVVRVQLGAFRNKLSKNIFEGIDDLVVIKGEDGLTRYYSGSFPEMNAAARHKVEMLVRGFSGAFLVAFRDGKRISLKEAGAQLTGPDEGKEIIGGIDRSMISYKVQVGTFAGNVPMEVMDKFIEVGNVTPVTSVDAVRYFHGSFKSRSEAEAARTELINKGLSDAFVVGALGTRIIPADEADRLLAE